MNRAFLVLGITLAAALPAHADLTHKIQSSVQLEVGGASTRAIRVGNSYSISGTRVSTAGDGTTAGVVGGLGAAQTELTPSQSQTHHKQPAATLSALPTATPVGDTIPTSAPTVGEVPAFGDVTSLLLELQALAWLARSPQQVL